jgi:hypothetical protein
VPPEHFIGRKDSLRTIFSRIHNGESTAIVGGPHIGKSSALRYIADDRSRSEWLAQSVKQYTFIEIDCQPLPSSYQPEDFWKYVLDQIEITFPEEIIKVQLGVVRQSTFGSLTLEGLFRLLDRRSLQAVLLIDEFDTLLYHPNFNTAEFFGALRALSTRTGGLMLVVANRLPIAEMNRRSHEINPIGSPFFNNFTEVRLPLLNPTEVDELLNRALRRTKIRFSQEERDYIRRVTGGHPYLVQAAAAALFDAITQRQVGEVRFAHMNKALRSWTEAHFDDMWWHLTLQAQRTMYDLALAELNLNHRADNNSITEKLVLNDVGLRQLAEDGLIEETDPGGWRISAESFASWIVDNATPTSQSTPQLDATQAKRTAELRDFIDAHCKRLYELRLKEAKYGIDVGPAITNEIKEIEGKIADLEAQLKDLNES